MDIRTFLYLLVGLVYVLYPLYYLSAIKRTDAMHRVFALGLMVYGGLLLYWPGRDELLAQMAVLFGSDLYTPETAVFLGALMVAAGFGLYRQLLTQCLPWIAAMAYALMVIHWPGLEEPLGVVIAMFVIVVALDKCLRTQPITEAEAVGDDH